MQFGDEKINGITMSSGWSTQLEIYNSKNVDGSQTLGKSPILLKFTFAINQNFYNAMQ